MKLVEFVLKKFWAQVEKSDAKRIASQTPTPGMTEILDIPYIKDGTRAHLLDIYYPEGQREPLPVIIDIHGGGWMYGYKEINKYFCLKLAKKGFLVASINYRLAGDVLFPDQIRDIFAAFSWLSQNLGNYPADTDNVFLAGDSAGGHFTCLCTAINESAEMRADFSVPETGLRFRAAAAICPAVNLGGGDVLSRAMTPILLGKDYKKTVQYKYMNFANIASRDLPPFYILTASGDFLRKQGYLLAEILGTHGAEYKLHDFDALLNGKKLPHVFNVTDPYSVYGEQANTEITEFFKSKLCVKAK